MLRSVRYLPRLASLYQRAVLRVPLYTNTCRQLSAAAQDVIEVASDQDFNREVKAADGGSFICGSLWTLLSACASASSGM